MQAATIRLFLLHGDPKQLRTAEIINWTGKALAAPRTEFQSLLERKELIGSGIYVLTGTDPNTGREQAYVGEAEVLRERLPHHKGKDFWQQVIAFVSKDENLTKSHIRYLEGRLIENTKAAGRFEMINSQASGALLPESDRHDMELFLTKVEQLLPVLGCDIVTPIAKLSLVGNRSGVDGKLICEIKGIRAEGQRTATGFTVFAGSQAVEQLRASAQKQSPFVVVQREKLLLDGVLSRADGYLSFAKDVEFTSPSAAASLIHGGSANGLEAWRDAEGRALKYLEDAGIGQSRDQ